MKKGVIPTNHSYLDVLIYDESDRESFKNIYDSWINLSSQLNAVGARKIPFPHEIAEGLFCLEMNAVKPMKNQPFDCIIPEGNIRIEIKAVSNLPDFTLIRTDKDDWDELFFMDFFVNGDWDGKFNIYKIEKTLLFQNLKGNPSRPKVSIYKDIIQKYGLNPIVSSKI